jgi:hypothetical protein
MALDKYPNQWGGEGEMLDTATALLPIRPLAYKRQRFLLEILRKLGAGATATDLQKIVFLYFLNVEAGEPCYEFVPYRFGPYSFHLAQDVEALRAGGYIGPDNRPAVPAIPQDAPWVDDTAIETLRGEPLIRKAYRQYPHYAIRSEIAEKILDAHDLGIVRTTSQQLESCHQTLFSKGYEGIRIEAFINVLLLRGVKLLCDVRRNAISRKFGFSAESLRHKLNNVGIQYLHVPELGIDSQKRKALFAQSDYDSLFDDYRKSLPQRRDALDLLHSLLVSNRRIALMCFERDPRCCHRTIIKEHLADAHALDTEDC